MFKTSSTSLERMNVNVNSSFYKNLLSVYTEMFLLFKKEFNTLDYTSESDLKAFSTKINLYLNQKLIPVVQKHLNVKLTIDVLPDTYMDAVAFTSSIDSSFITMIHQCVPKAVIQELANCVFVTDSIDRVNNKLSKESRNFTLAYDFTFVLSFTLGILFGDPNIPSYNKYTPECIVDTTLHELGHIFYSMERLIALEGSNNLCDLLIEKSSSVNLLTYEQLYIALTEVQQNSFSLINLLTSTESLFDPKFLKFHKELYTIISNNVTVFNDQIKDVTPVRDVSNAIKTFSLFIINGYRTFYEVTQLTLLTNVGSVKPTINQQLEYERYADEFAIKSGGGKALPLTLTIIEESHLNNNRKKFSNQFVGCGLIAEWIYTQREKFVTKNVTLQDVSIYDPLPERMERIILHYNEMIHNSNVPMSIKKEILANIKTTRNIIEEYKKSNANKYKFLFANISKWFTNSILKGGSFFGKNSDKKLTDDYRVLNNIIESMIKNDAHSQKYRLQMMKGYK